MASLKALGEFTQEGSTSIKTLVVTKSGQYLDGDGNIITLANFGQYMTPKVDLYNQVIRGELGSSTDPKYLKRGLSYNNKVSKVDDPTATNIHLDYTNNYDHLAIDGLPANLSDSDLEKYKSVVAETFGKLNAFFVADNKPNLIMGERQVLVRIDKMANGTQDPHIHIVANRHSIAKRDDLVTELQFCTDTEKKKALQKAIDFSVGKDKVLMQSCNFSSNNYVNAIVINELNKNLVNAGLSPLTGYTMSNNKGTNAPISQESKAKAKEIVLENYTPESVEKLIQKTETEVTSLDSVILQKRLAGNNSRIAELSEELARLASESRTLNEAQTALNENVLLKQEIQVKDGIIADFNNEVFTKNEAIETLEATKKELTNIVNSVRDTFEIPYEVDLKTGVSAIVENLVNNEANLQDEFKIFKETALDTETSLKLEINTYQNTLEKTQEDLATEKEKVEEYKAQLFKEQTEKAVLAEQVKQAQDLNGILNNSVSSMKSVNESQAIQLTEAHTKNSNLSGENQKLRDELKALKEAHYKELETLSNEKAVLTKANTELKKVNEENDKKFREFATSFISEVGSKIKTLANALKVFGKKIDDPEKAKELKNIADGTNSLIKSFQDKYNPKVTDTQKDNSDPNKNKYKK